jgi:tetratricopeptide (TPR) repeat protein
VSSDLGVERDRIFISYRRDDARAASGRLWDWLRIGFGRDHVFRDVASIGAGKWRVKIEQALRASCACVAVIGRRWADGTNLPRLQDPNDMVRHELETALACGDREELTLIPVLVEDAQLTTIPSDQLPASLQPLLADWNVLALSEMGWDEDTLRLIEALATATGLAVNPELREWMELMAGAREGLSRARGGGLPSPTGAEGEAQALEGLLQRVAGAEQTERPALKAALSALAAGHTLLAEQSFEEEWEASQRLRQAAEQQLAYERRREADAARHIANLALVRGDLTKALRFLQRALEAWPEDFDALWELGYAWISRGDLARARGVFETLIHQGATLGEPRQESRGHKGLGDVLVSLGDVPGALASYQAALALDERLVQGDPAHGEWQRNLSLSQERLGKVYMLQGDATAALMAYEASLAIRDRLVQRDPANGQWQRDRAVSLEQLGDGRMAKGERASAMAAYEASLAIRDHLVQRDPTNTLWQRDRAVALEKLGAGRMAQGDPDGALAAYEASLAIRDSLTQRDPANQQWQRDRAVSLDKVGDGRLGQNDRAAAQEAYGASLAIRETLVARDPANTDWQRDRFVSCIKIGDLLQAQGDEPAALAAFQAGLPIAEGLARRDPTNAQWQRDRAICHGKIGDGLVAQGDLGGAVDAYQRALAISDQLANREPAHPQWALDVALACAKLGALDDGLPVSERMAHLSRGQAILMALEASNKPAACQEWEAWFAHRLQQLQGGA